MKKGNCEIKPTAGNWNYKIDGFKITIGNEKQELKNPAKNHDYTVCEIDDNSMQAEANAKLIAAAPELLETLSVVLEHIQQTKNDFEYNGLIVPKTDLIRYIEMAIQKATE